MQPPSANRHTDPEPEPSEGWQGGAGYDFEPKPDVLERHLSTRKYPFDLARLTFPGLFGEQMGGAAVKATGNDLGWFKLAVVAEIFTATILSVIVVNVFALPFYAGLLPLAGILGLDGLLAILHHLPVADRCLRGNQELLVVRDLRGGVWNTSRERTRISGTPSASRRDPGKAGCRWFALR